MKLKIILLSFVLVNSFSSIGQNKESLKNDVLKAYKASTSMDYDMIFETTYPKVFDIIPRESMKEMFKQMMENEQFSIKLIEVDPEFTYGEIKKIGDKTFCLIDHNNVMKMRFKKPLDGDPEMMINTFKSSMGAEKVTFDKANNSFRIELRSTLIGVSDTSTNNTWKFLNKDKDNKLFNMLFDEKTKETLGL